MSTCVYWLSVAGSRRIPAVGAEELLNTQTAGHPASGAPPAGGGMNLEAMGLTPVVTIACHPDTQRVGQSVRMPLLSRGNRLAISRMAPDFLSPDGANAGPLLDTFVSRSELWLEIEDGALWIDPKDMTTEIAVDRRLITGRTAIPLAGLHAGTTLKIADRVLLILHLRMEPMAPVPEHGLTGASDSMQQMRHDVAFAAEGDGGVLVLGEAGSGKETVVRAIRAASDRRDDPYQCVNAAAIPPEHLHGVLFGTGERAKGAIEHADGGVLHIAEIGELPPTFQRQIVQLINEGRITDDDGGIIIEANVRVIGSTDADLSTSVYEGHFSEELLDLLEADRVRVPPLRERSDDIPLTFLTVLTEELEATGELELLADPGPGVPPWLPADMMQRLLDYEWPSNVRQLIAVARALVTASRGAFTARSNALVERFLPPPADAAKIEGLSPPATSLTPVENITTDDLIAALRAYRWSAAAAGRHLGVSKNTVYELLAACAAVVSAEEMSDAQLKKLKRQYRADVHLMAEALEMSRRGLQRRLWRMESG